MEIKIKCKSALNLDPFQIQEFQGELKSLSKTRYEQLKKSILTLGFSFPESVWKDPKTNKWVCLDGHQRLRTLKQMVSKEGFTCKKIPCSIIEADNKKQAKLKLLAAASQYGKVESDGLHEFMMEANISLQELTENFHFPEIDLPDFSKEFFDNDIQQGEVEGQDDIPDKVDAIVKYGDIYVLGEHRLMCGDSTDISSVEKLMNGDKADITFTSPPYNAGRFGYDGGKDKYKGSSDDKTQDEYFDFLVSFTNICIEVSKYVFINNQFLSGNRHALGKFFGQYSSMIKEVFPWIKNTAPPNVNKGVFTNRFEFFLCLESDNTKKGFPCDWQGKYNNVIEGHTASKDNVSPSTHSATMPSYVPEWFFERLSFIKSVYEPFGGTGTTAIACEKTNRRCFMMEIDPHYCDIIIARWEKFTGKKAEKVTDGTR